MSYYLTEGDDIITGTDASDRFVDRGPMGGFDVLDGRGGDDQFDLGPGGAGTVDGGAGFDTVVADYTNLGSMVFSNVERLEVLGDSFNSTIAQLSAFGEISTIYSTFSLSLSGAGGELDFSTRLGFQKMELFAAGLTSPALITGSKGSDTFHDLRTGYLDGSGGTDLLVLLSTPGTSAISLESMVIKNVEKLFSDTVITARIDQMQGFSSIEATTLRLVGSGGTLNLAGALQGHVDASGLTSGATLTVGDGHYEGSLIGSNFNDVLSGSIRNDTIMGGLGNDTLNGGSGHDTLLGIRAGGDDAVFGEGTDVLNGGDGLDHLYGGGNDILNGGNGNDTIFLQLGGSGTIDGGADVDGVVANVTSLGNFTFQNVENLSSSHSLIGKLAQFNAFQGISVVGTIGLTGVGGTLNLSARVESAVKVNASALTSAIVLSGGTEGDSLTGTNYNDTLDGKAWSDQMSGGKGNDVYIVDNVNDKVVENVSEGIDLIRASTSYILAANVENLTLAGTSKINATGNGLTNILAGNTADNILDGKAGADRMAGGVGNDIYVVDAAGDRVLESTNAGVDRVQASISYALSSNVENLTLAGSGSFYGYGNLLANTIVGNKGANALDGKAGNDSLQGETGNDTLIGSLGADRLYGGIGADRFVFNYAGESTVASSGRDTIYDFDRLEGDKIDLSVIDASTKLSGNQAFKFLGSAAYTKTAGELRTVVKNGDTFIYGDVNGDGATDFSIMLDASARIYSTDFIL